MIIAHAYLFSLEYIENMRQLYSLLNSTGLLASILMNSTVVIDTFLLMSGTLLAYKVFRLNKSAADNQQKSKKLCLLRWSAIYLHRFVRVLPTYLLTFLFMKNFFNISGDGPMWSTKG